MGKFAGEKIIDTLGEDVPDAPKDAGERSFSLFSRFMNAGGKDNLGKIREEMRNLMTEKVGVFRTEQGMNDAIEGLRELKERADKTVLASQSLIMNQDLIQRWELNNLLDNAMVITKGALNRKESRGGHFRDDFPERDDTLHYHTLAYMTGFGDVHLENRPVDMSLYDAKGEHYERFGVIERKY